MKKKREAKRQAKQQQEVENPNDDKQNQLNKTDEPIDNDKQLRIKKILSVCIHIYNFVNNLCLLMSKI